MTYSIFYRASAESDLQALHEPIQTEVRTAIKSLANAPHPPGVRKLAGMDNAYRIRIGKYRVGYQIIDQRLIVTIVAIAERDKVYPLLKRRLK